jgi:Rieske Fe-S protein
MLITDLIQGRANPWEDLYNPSRLKVRAAGTFLKETVNMATQYADWLTGGDVDDVQAIAAGHGAIVRRGLRKIAVYREAGGSLVALSASCPHLGCVVAWNDVEKSWDCPCHGSRFGPTGKVLNGPAISDLHPATPEPAVRSK